VTPRRRAGRDLRQRRCHRRRLLAVAGRTHRRIGWPTNTADHGLIVNGNDVTLYGLFVDDCHRNASSAGTATGVGLAANGGSPVAHLGRFP
jgi:hypothetical protein